MAFQGDLTGDPLLFSAPSHEGYKVLGGVVLYQKLGQGGMGAVYRGKHLRLEVDVALKVMASPGGLAPAHTDNYVQRFLREAKTAAAVKHQNLIRVYDVNSENEVHYIIMDYVDGESAGDRLKRKGALTEQEAVEITIGAAQGLAAAHKAGIVHRDVKPDNILIDKDGNVVVADLGLAKAFGGDSDSSLSMGLSVTQQAIGTPYFMAPEQTRSAKDVTPRADVWSLGVTLYQLASGALPWSDTDLTDLIYKIRNDALPDIETVCAGLSPGLCMIIDRALKKEPSERYADCREMATALKQHLDTIKQSTESILPDEQAGTTKGVALTMSPPPTRTLTMIGNSILQPSGSGRMPAYAPPPSSAAMPAASPPGAIPKWALWAAVGGGALLVVGALLLVLLLAGNREAEPVAEEIDIEAEADTFYGEQQEATIAEKYAQVLAAIDATDGKYERTTYGLRLSKLRDKAAEKVAEAEAAKITTEFDLLLAKADAAQAEGDLAAAARELNRALALRNDGAVQKRLANIKTQMRLAELIELADKQEKASEFASALAAIEGAIQIAKGEQKRTLESRTIALKQRIAAEKYVVRMRAKANAKDWRGVWNAVNDARRAGLEHAEFDTYARSAAKRLAPPARRNGPHGIQLVLMSGGTFQMGADDGRSTERPRHEVTVSPFYIAKSELTRSQLAAAEGQTLDANDESAARPATSLSYEQATRFCRLLKESDSEKATYRLPAEAEWEFAARGAEGRKYPWGQEPPNGQHANVAGPEDGHEGLAPVASFPKGATPEGLMDMAGNAAEWCSDWYGRYPSSPQTDPAGPAQGKARAVRGGAYALDASYLRAAARSGRNPSNPAEFIGLRIVRELSEEEAELLRLSRAGK